MLATQVSPLLQQLERDGIAMVPGLVTPQQLRSMQAAFATRLKHLRWNDVDGYEKTERYRHMVQDVLTLDQGFVDAATDPIVTEALRAYVGPNVQLCEAKGWRSLPTKFDFHGWHGDMWYDQTKVDTIPREVKLAIYLTDVKSGAFKYVKGSHAKQAPRILKRGEADQFDPKDIVEVLGPAGSAFVFDTSGIHRQSIPILQERRAVFLNYHESQVPLQPEDVEYYRYHPLLLNAAFLGDLSEDDRRLLGFGDKTNYVPNFERQTRHRGFHRLIGSIFSAKLVTGEYRQRIWGKLKRVLRLGR
jgi:Phytanoyl-CoA dioxygenase (PhyH)